MGIRFDRRMCRATNGPLFFFNDISAESGFEDEINRAIISGLSFYSYHIPGSSMITFGSSENYLEEFGEPGFVIGLFDNTLPIITIPTKPVNGTIPSQILYRMPSVSTSYEEYRVEVDSIISELKKKKDGKLVAARVKIIEKKLDLAELFYQFCKKFPESYIFCFSTPATGCWIGASPELLLEGRGNRITTMALAGTRLNRDTNPWDKKNIKEQEIVNDYIIRVFKENGLDIISEETFTKNTGDIQHICTQIEAQKINNCEFDLSKLLHDFWPTPALCGNPKEYALKEIKKHERFDRGCYGGFCGIFDSEENFIFNVVLRCASVSENRYCIYAGGGITASSNVENEWMETEIKIKNTFGSCAV